MAVTNIIFFICIDLNETLFSQIVYDIEHGFVNRFSLNLSQK